MRYFTILNVILSAIFLNASINAQQVVINELMPSNGSTISDEDGEYSDWIELYNSSTQSVDLTGFGISDDPSNPFKWIFPAVTVDANDHLLIFASDKNRTIYYKHWETIITWGDVWKYKLGTSEPVSDWKNLGFNDQTWLSGPSGIGYGDNDDSTIIPSVQSVYLRKTFNIDDTTKILNAVLHVDYDDAFVAYLNGVEIARANIGTPGVSPAYNSSADNYVEPLIVFGGKPVTFELPEIRSKIRSGENVLAIQVHQYGTGSSDLTIIPFLTFGMDEVPPNERGSHPILPLPNKYLHTNYKLSVEGESIVLTDRQGITIDQVTFSPLVSDISLGRLTDGNSSWVLFSEPTPGASNHGDGFSGFTDEPGISVQAGFHSSPINVVLSAASVYDTLHYTLNGSEPTVLSSKYTSPIQINSTTVLRVKAFRTGYLPSKISTRTYLLNFSTQLPVVSISTNPENFFDEEYGIYSYGDSAETSFPYFGANFWKEWERPAHVELFDDNGSGFSMDAGVQIFGGWSRGHPQKSLAIYARGQYGYSSINYKLFNDLPFTEFQSFVLRNSGNDWTSTMFRDGLMTGLLEGIDIEKQAFKPAIVFINGTYWGIQNIREKVNEHYLAQHKNVNSDSVDILQMFGEVVQGDNEDFLSLHSFIEINNLNVPINYEFVNTKIDIQDFIRYYVSQIYFANTDWPGSNIKYWRDGKNGKWRWILFDTDFGFGLYEPNPYKHNTLEFATTASGSDWPNPPWSTLFLRKLLDNPSFKYDFINCFADFANSIFKPAAVNNRINLLKTKIESEITRHSQRWNQFDFNGWLNNVQYLRDFANQRLTYMQLHFVQKFGLAGLAPVNLAIADTSMGSIALNSLSIDIPSWTGSYFLGVPIKIIAKHKNGFRFVRWEGSITSSEDSLSISVSNAVNLKAVFEVDSNFKLPHIVINEINYNSSASRNSEDWIELYNNSAQSVDLSGWIFKDSDDAHIFTLPANSILESSEYVVLCIDTALFKSVCPDVRNFVGNTGFGLSGSGELIRLYDNQMNLIDSLTFDDVSPWPTKPDGDGATLSLKNPDLDNSIAENWTASLSYGTPGKVNDVLSEVTTENEFPADFILYQNFPNPFNSETIISYSVPRSAFITLKIYDILGREVNVLMNEYKSAGNGTIKFSGDGLPSGVYFCSMQAGSFSDFKKLILLK